MEIGGVLVLLLSVIVAVAIAFVFLRNKGRASSVTNAVNITAASDYKFSADSVSTTNVMNKTSATSSFTSADSVSTTNAMNKTSAIDSFTSADSEQVPSKRESEVFLSFCGVDTRDQFTDFLYTYLKNASIQTFRDNEGLRVGEEIAPELLKAIKESRISIPILSKNYASSKWCLLELTEMVNCHTNGGHMIIPIFYDVNPSDVRNQNGSYELAFREHRKKYKKETVESWMEALKKVGVLKGYELKKETNGRQGELVEMVTEEVLVRLKKNYTILPKNLVGIDESVEKLKALLKLASGGVRIVGIHGMGGLGKTTLAKAAYNKLCGTFERHYFLDNVRENTSSKVQLITNGRGEIEDKVSGRKVLLVLDDVDNYSQVETLMGRHIWYGANSRIIITTRDEKILRAVEGACRTEDPQDICVSYKPDYMSVKDSLQLFSKFAFMRDSPIEGFELYSEEVVSIAAGLPLVLVVLGSLFFPEKDKSFWEAKLKMCRMIPVEGVLEKLKISFDVLPNEQKKIFLDIACFFIGTDVRRASYMWDDCKYFPEVGIRDLISKSLITVGYDNIIGMHDQLRDLGRDIVRKEGSLGSPSRLWRAEDAISLLESSQEAQSVEAISLAYYVTSPFDGPLLPSSFRGIPNLKYLSLDIFEDLEGDFKHIFSNLRWLHWDGFEKFTPTNLQLKKLVILSLHPYFSNQQSAEDWQGLMNQLNTSVKLKVLELSGHYVREIPHLATYTSLEDLCLYGCETICRLDGLEQLISLKYLDARDCVSLDTLPNLSKLTNLVKVYIGCEKIDEIKGLWKLNCLEYLHIEKCANIDELKGLGKLECLEYLHVEACGKIGEIKGVGKLNSLEYLHVKECASLKVLPGLSNLKRLKRLEVHDSCKLVIEVDRLNELNALEVLNLVDCGSLNGILDMSNMCNLIEVCAPELKVSNIVNSKLLQKLVVSFSDIPIKFRGIDALQYLHVAGGSVKILQNLSCLRSLRKIDITNTNELITIEDIGELESLETLAISDCHSIEIFLSNLRKLQYLSIHRCEKLSGIQGLDRMESLKVINISECPSLERFHGHAIHESLERLVLQSCRNLKEISVLQSFQNLKILGMSFLENLTEIVGLEEVKSLEYLVCDGCNSITKLPDLTKL